MRDEIRRADAQREVVATAEAWRRAGAIDDAALAAIRARHPDDRRRSRAGFRLLFFLFTLLGGLATFGFAMALLGLGMMRGDQAKVAALLVVAAVVAALAADALTRIHRLRELGVEEGLIALALGWALVAIVLGADLAGLAGESALFARAAAFALLAAAAAWRWAPPLAGVLAAGALFAALYGLPAARLLWILAGALLAWLARRGAGDERVAVAHRRRLDEAFVVAVAALYLAVHVAGISSDWFAWLTRRSGLTREISLELRALAWAAMTALPAALLAAGIRRRDRLQLALGGLLALATAASAADALALEPAWLVLTGAGVLLLAGVVALRRLLAARPNRTVGGFTDRALYEPDGRRSFLELAATLAALSPAPRPTEPEPGFRGRGGDFGGGGASGKF
jgi:MFS family permease